MFKLTNLRPRRSLASSPGRKTQVEVLAPTLLSSILSQQCKNECPVLSFAYFTITVWLLRNEIGDRFDSILEKFLSLSFSSATKVMLFIRDNCLILTKTIG